jgi:hypothetical protein
MHTDNSTNNLKIAFTELYDNPQLDELELAGKNGKLGSLQILGDAC